VASLQQLCCWGRGAVGKAGRGAEVVPGGLMAGGLVDLVLDVRSHDEFA
jgi:hypothetical protein